MFTLLIHESENRIFEWNELVHNFLNTMFEKIPKVIIASWRLGFEFSTLFNKRIEVGLCQGKILTYTSYRASVAGDFAVDLFS